MNEQGKAAEEVIHFCCGHCHISLTFDDSIAGVTGPCPSCGKTITAPTFGDLQGSAASAVAEGLEAPRESRSTGSELGVSPTRSEQGRRSSVTRFLGGGFVLLVVILGLAFWLYRHFRV